VTANPVWLNAASLGSSNAQKSYVDTKIAASDLQQSFRRCIEWVADWCASAPNQALLTNGTTDACEIALITRVGLPHIVMHSDLAHDSTRRTVSCVAEFFTQLGQHPVASAELKISDLFGKEPEEFAIELARRAESICLGGAGALVLEHVTSEDGYLLPLREIIIHLRSALPTLAVVVDGAQASGLWQPPSNLDYAYAGCFHKYVDGPVSTGFCVLPNGLASKSLHRVRSTHYSRLQESGEYLPTTDISKWSECALALTSLRSRGPVDVRVKKIQHLRCVLLERLNEHFSKHIVPVRQEYRSHIVSLRFNSSQRSREVWSRLVDAGFATKQLESGIRITLHDTLSSDSVCALTDTLNETI